MNSSLNIIYLEDSDENASIVLKSLDKGRISADVKTVSTRQQFIAAITGSYPDLILAAYQLPDINCTEALAILRQKSIQVPFLVVSGVTSDEMEEEMLLIGADDYIIKDQAGRLPFAVIRSLEKYQFKQQQQRLTQQLTDGEKWFRTLVENSTDAVVVFDAAGAPQYASPAVKNVLGYTPEEVVGIDIFSKAHPDDVTAITKVMEKVFATPNVTIPGHTARMLHKNGQWRWIEASITNLLHEPAINGIVDNFRDVTAQRISEDKILHLNRLYAFLSQVNQALVHAPDMQTVFREVCRIATETGKFQGAWIGTFNTRSSTVDVMEHRGIADDYLTGFITSEQMQREVSTLLDFRPYFVSNNIQQDFVSEHWKALAASAGYQSCMVLPITKTGNIAGSFHLYAAETEIFTKAEINLLREAAGGISFCLDLFEKEKSRLLADEQLKHKEKRLSQAQAIAHLGSWETDLTTNSSVWSDEACRIYGLPASENIQSTDSWLSFVHPEDLQYVIQRNKEVLDAMQPVEYYHRIIRTDGQVRYLRVQTHIELNGQGQPVSLYGVLHDVTQKQESEQALKSSESKLRAIFENTSQGFILTDEHATVRHYNSKAQHFYRRNTGGEIRVGSSLFEVIDLQRRPEFIKEITKVLSGAVWQYERAYNNDGTQTWLNVTVNPVHENDLVTGLCLTITDITDGKIAQELLEKSESSLNAVMNNTDALIYSLDSNHRYITCNLAYKSMMKERYGIDVHPGLDVSDSFRKFDPDAVDEWKQISERALAGEVLKFEKEISLDGMVSHFKFSIYPISENGNITGISCFVNDVTKEKQADEKALKALEDKYDILESIGDGFYALDKEWIVTYWNKQAEILLNCPKETILGRNIWEIFAGVVGTEIYYGYHRALENNTIEHFGAYYYAGGNAWYEVTAYPSVNGLSVYFRDVTERRQSESKLNELNENLRNYANELVESNKGLEQFSYIVSHNLRAPVANIIGLAKLVSQDIYPSDVKEQFIDGILLNINRLDDVVADLNTILHIKREVGEIKESVNIQQLVEAIRLSINNIIEKEQVIIKTDFTAVNELFTLKSYLHSILYNLIMNSIKYRRPDVAPVICIRTSSDNGQVTIWFQDNGLGIDLPRKGKQVFGLYKRFHQHVEGKGMGLFMVKTQVELLGGEIHVASVLNEGTEFRIELRSNHS